MDWMLLNTDQVLMKVTLNFGDIAGVLWDSGLRHYWWIAGGRTVVLTAAVLFTAQRHCHAFCQAYEVCQ